MSDEINDKSPAGPRPAVGHRLWRMIRYAGLVLAGGLATLVGVGAWVLEQRPDLEVWHRAALDAEYTAGAEAKDFAGYLAAEERLFAQLGQQVYDRVDAADRSQINRYFRGSLSDPATRPVNWNRTFEWPAKSPRAGVLLLHGMSDSPYSLRSLGRRFNADGAWVVGLRLPGHGTAPVGLVTVRWQDMAAAVDLATRHLKDRVGDRPLFVVGYSNGAALAVHHALLSLSGEESAAIDRMVLISPSLGVTSLAALAVWQARLGWLLGLEKLAWTDILPEYDPYKYNSFAVNAGDQVHRLTTEIQRRLHRLAATDALQRFPPTLAFQSLVDATVSTGAVIDGFYDRLPGPNGHQLVLFDINRLAKLMPVLAADPLPAVRTRLAGPPLSYTLDVVTNAAVGNPEMVLLRRRPGAEEMETIPLALKWPPNTYSLSHVALPFPPEDPLYGRVGGGERGELNLGDLALRGERGVLRISPAAMLRLRNNAFYDWIEKRSTGFLDPTADP